MPYTIQLSPTAAKATVRSREDIKKIVALFDRMKKAEVFATPFFPYIQKRGKLRYPEYIHLVLKKGKGYNKASYRNSLKVALRELYRREGDTAATEVKAAAEAEAILSLIAEYRSLPE